MQLHELNERSQDIFRTIVETYLRTGDPVGSRTLSRTGTISVSPATIRNVMADLEDAGLLESPHTSAGRRPTDLGLRMFVDGMLEIGNLTANERESIKGKSQSVGRTLEEVLKETTQALSGLSKCASMVMVPKQELAVRQIEFVPLGQDRALVVLVSEQGTVENRIISVPPGVTPSELNQASNYLTARLAGRTVEEARLSIEEEVKQQQTLLDSLTKKVIDSGLAVWAGGDDPSSLIISGQANLLENLEAQEDLERIRQLFEELDKKSELIRLLQLAKDAGGVKLFIGSENNLFSLTGSSVVVSPYMNGANKIVGVVGVIGPTRLNYSRIIPMVDYTARIVSRLL
ncbi:heat-inducible transcription repressor HrcA [Kordiimonas sediminis]|uniref:Heat-inducible transcription repressor HrcA n=1 Tax=Kordiimonas sediminis TaxID=1735581 RepID=A0A919AM90_9PROT|nr:heat-inducible transcriptional repressor HrcA [Kordiimonas sediminis]GHF15648.1 heat-inducible transcription repressor HrcA [Kordiimonas sediminis]